MRVQERKEIKPRKSVKDIAAGEVFKFEGKWYMGATIDLDGIKNGYSETIALNGYKASWDDCREGYEIAAVALETGCFYFFDGDWEVEDWGIANLEIIVRK